MKSATLIGIILVILGIFALVYQGFTYTKRQRVVGLALVGGIVLIAVGSRN